MHAEVVLELARRDQHCRAGREANDDGVRNKVDERAHAGDAHDQHQDAGQEGECESKLHILFGSGHSERAQCCEHHDGHGGGRARDEVPGRAEQRADDRRDHCRVHTILWWQAGDRRVGDRLGQDKDCARETGDGIRAKTLPVDARAPAEEGKQRRERGPVVEANSHGDGFRTGSMRDSRAGYAAFPDAPLIFLNHS
jgi:hypothetical protein